MAPVPSDPANITSGLTSILASLIPLLALLYIGGLLWTLDYAHRNPKLTIEVSKPQNRRYAPSKLLGSVSGACLSYYPSRIWLYRHTQPSHGKLWSS
jgi:hypothetical protein